MSISPTPRIDTRAELPYIHALRILACYLVLVNHTHGDLLVSGAPGSVLCFCLLFSLCKMGVTLYVMISGVLLLDRDYGAKKILWSIARVLVLLVGVTALLALWQEGPAGLEPLHFFQSLMAKPRMAPYWYLYALPLFYCTLPFLQRMARSFTLRDYVLFTVLLLLLPAVNLIMRSLFGLPVTRYFNFAQLPKFVTVAVAGKTMSLLPRRRRGMLLALAAFLLAWAGSFASFFVPWLREGEVSFALDSWDLLPPLVMAGSCVYLFGYFRVGERLRGSGPAILRGFAALSLGIYVVHPVFNHFVHELGFLRSLTAYSPYLGVPVYAILLFLLSALVVWLLRLIPLARKFL